MTDSGRVGIDQPGQLRKYIAGQSMPTANFEGISGFVIRLHYNTVSGGAVAVN